jgi:hypothetical protein
VGYNGQFIQRFETEKPGDLIEEIQKEERRSFKPEHTSLEEVWRKEDLINISIAKLKDRP